MTNYISRGGYWNNSLAWDPHGTPGSGDTATIGGQTVIIHSDAEAASTSVDGGSLIFQNGGNLHSSVSGGSVVVDAYATAYLHDINTLGSITVGKQADFVVLDNDPLTCELDAIPEIGVLQTYLDGEQRYRAR